MLLPEQPACSSLSSRRAPASSVACRTVAPATCSNTYAGEAAATARWRRAAGAPSPSPPGPPPKPASSALAAPSRPPAPRSPFDGPAAPDASARTDFALLTTRCSRRAANDARAESISREDKELSFTTACTGGAHSCTHRQLIAFTSYHLNHSQQILSWHILLICYIRT